MKARQFLTVNCVNIVQNQRFFRLVFSRIWIEYEDLHNKCTDLPKFTQSKYGKTQIGKNTNLDTCHAGGLTSIHQH